MARTHQEQLNFRRAQLTTWAQGPKPDKARTRTLIAALNALRESAYDTLRPHEATTLSLAIRRIRHLVQLRSQAPVRSYLPGRRRPGPLDRPLDL